MKRWKRIGLCGLLAAGLAVGMLAYRYVTEVPQGFQRVSFLKASRDAQYDKTGRVITSPKWQSLDGHAVFVKEIMYPEFRMEGLTSFFLVLPGYYGACGPQPQQAEMIRVELPDGQSTRYTDKLLSIAGEFHVKDFATTSVGQSPLVLTASSIEPAKTSF